ncbi:MAG: hypothetical protein ACI9R3_005701 [Verrucomicrobiales bacterium]|jgi:hypothetical protein
MSFFLPIEVRIVAIGIATAALHSGICIAQEVEGPLLLTEAVTWNECGLRDNTGRTPDWIELLNASEQALELDGYGLSDDRSGSTKWVFPARTLAAGARFIVFASGAIERSTSSEHHCNFKLSAGGEYLRVTTPDGTLSDAVELMPVTLPDVSQGRPDDTPDAWRFFDIPSAGEKNALLSQAFDAIAAPVQFSHNAGTYAESISLTLTGGVEEDIHYSLNGDIPILTSELYSTPIQVYDRSSEENGISTIEGTSIANQHTNGWLPPRARVPKAFTVRARAIAPRHLPGPVSTRTFFVGLDPAALWNIPVISLVTPADGLFDYETGIYMLGKVFDDFRAAHPVEPLTGHTSANYTQRGDAWERAGSFEFFESDGRLATHQNVVLDIQGQSSRSFRQKSLGLKPRGGLQSADTFEYPFFPGLRRRGLGGERTTFPGLRLRNSGNDWDYTMFRDALCHRIVSTLDLDVMTARPVVVFLNGEFWGLYNLREQGDLESVSVHYGIPKESVVLAEADGSVKEGDTSATTSYRALRRLVDRGLSETAAFEEASTMMDVDNFLRYQLAEIYLGNADWPHNNIRYWKSLQPDPADEEGNVPPGHDGRWRWMVFDTDLAYGHPWSGGTADNTLAVAISPVGRPGLNAPWSTALLRGLLTNVDFKTDFINSMACYLNADFSASRTRSLVTEMRGIIEPVMPEQLSRWRTSSGSTSTWSSNVRVMEGFARQRPAAVRRQLERAFDLAGSAKLSISVTPPGAGVVTVHRLKLDTDTAGIDAPVYPWQGTFFEGMPLTIHAAARPGYLFAGWESTELNDLDPEMNTILTDDTEIGARFEIDQVAMPLAEIAEFHFNQWESTASAGSQPPYFRFEQSTKAKVGADALMDSVWAEPYNLTDRSRFVGLDADGVGFKDTGRSLDSPSGGIPGAVVLALDTRNVSSASVAWTAATVTPGDHPFAIRLQIAVGGGTFTDILDGLGNPVTFLSESVPSVMRFPPIKLPALAINQPHVELRWRYHSTSGHTGGGPMLRLDDIVVSTEAIDDAPIDRITSVRWLSNNAIRLSFIGTQSRAHILQWSTDLQTWTDGAPFTTDENGKASLNVSLPRPRMPFVRVARLESPAQ